MKTPARLMGCLAIAFNLAAMGQTQAPTRPDLQVVRIPGTVIEVEMVRLPGGELPDVWVARTEVTWDLYDVFLYGLDVPEGEEDADAISRPSKPYVPPDRGMGHSGFPAIGMTRHAAESFCGWLSTKTGLVARLPTPEEFEAFAAAGPGVSAGDLAWCAERSDDTTHPAASLPANAFGLHDTLGNVAEWVAAEGRPTAMGGSYRDALDDCTPSARQVQSRSWNRSDPQIPKSRWWLADCSWVGFRFVVEETSDDE